MDPETFKQLNEFVAMVMDKVLALATLWLGYKMGHIKGRNGSGNTNGNGEAK
jgi:hypothetical protein